MLSDHMSTGCSFFRSPSGCLHDRLEGSVDLESQLRSHELARICCTEPMSGWNSPRGRPCLGSLHGFMARSYFSKRGSESLEGFLERSQQLSQDTERLFRDWTVHLAGEPGERPASHGERSLGRQASQEVLL